MKHPIKTSESDPAFLEEITEEAGAEKILMCFNCKGCSTGCPVTDVVPQYNIKKTSAHVCNGAAGPRAQQ